MGNVIAFIEMPELMVIVSCVAALERLATVSVAITWKVIGPVAGPVGEPVMTPAGESDRPAGRFVPFTTAHV